jgi:hypothetical protein
LQIFDRFGNLVYKQISNTEFIWDGKFNGRNVTQILIGISSMQQMEESTTVGFY